MSPTVTLEVREVILSALDRVIDKAGPCRTGFAEDIKAKNREILDAIASLAIASVEARLAGRGTDFQRTVGRELDQLLDEAFALAVKVV